MLEHMKTKRKCFRQRKMSPVEGLKCRSLTPRQKPFFKLPDMEVLNEDVVFILNQIIDKCPDGNLEECDKQSDLSRNSSGFEDFIKSPPEKFKYSPNTSTPIHSENDECLDDTIDAAMKKYEFSPTKKILRDAFVQTVFSTADNQCQCELVQSSPKNKIEKFLSDEEPENRFSGDQERYSNCYSAITHSKCNSRIRLGLSKRTRPRTFAKFRNMSTSHSETILLPQNIDSGTYSKLVLLLSENFAWRTVADSFGIFSDDDIEMLMKSPKPAEKLLLELGSRLCTVEILCEVFKECQFYNILMLFKEKEPVQIIEQSYASGDDSVQMVIRGQSIKLTAKAVGIPPPTYQWYHNNLELFGKTEPILLIPHFDLESEGEYYCLIQQEDGEAVCSHPVTLMLAPERPVITKQPSAQEVCPLGSKVTLFVKAKGHPKPNYQWYKGNSQLDGCTSPTLVVDVKHENQDGKYWCYIYNSAGEIWSNKSTITVYTTPHPEPSAKLALLIANQLYDNLNGLYTPENDVKTLADLLQDLGFHVISLQNLNLVEMRNAIKTFSKILPSDAYVVFYFAGHGFEIQDKFMLPVDTPGPEDYLQTDAICERELLRAILSSNPKLFLQLLDMCLKPPSPLNKKIFQKTTDLYEYEANNNLIQGYSTTSYLGAYEKKTGKNGLYVDHLKRYLTKDKDLPIVEILQKVAKDVAAACMKQKPFFGTNVTMDYRLTDHCKSNPAVDKKIAELSAVPEDTVLKFSRVHVDSKVTFSPHMDVFLNTLEVRFSNLESFRIACEAEGEELRFEMIREGNVLVIKVINIQRLVTNKTLTLSLTKDEELLDCAVWDLGKPMIAVADLWWNSNLAVREDGSRHKS